MGIHSYSPITYKQEITYKSEIILINIMSLSSVWTSWDPFFQKLTSMVFLVFHLTYWVIDHCKIPILKSSSKFILHAQLCHCEHSWWLVFDMLFPLLYCVYCEFIGSAFCPGSVAVPEWAKPCVDLHSAWSHWNCWTLQIQDDDHNCYTSIFPNRVIVHSAPLWRAFTERRVSGEQAMMQSLALLY